MRPQKIFALTLLITGISGLMLGKESTTFTLLLQSCVPLIGIAVFLDQGFSTTGFFLGTVYVVAECLIGSLLSKDITDVVMHACLFNILSGSVALFMFTVGIKIGLIVDN